MNLRKALCASALILTPALACAHPGHDASDLMAGGIVGLCIGAVILAGSYKVLMDWVAQVPESAKSNVSAD